MLLHAQGVVRGVLEVPGRQRVELARGPAHGAVALAAGEEGEALAAAQPGRLAGLEAIVGELVVDDGGGLAAGDVAHVRGVGTGAAQQRPGRARAAQHRLRRRLPARLQVLAQAAPARRIGEVRILRAEGQ